MNEQDERPPKRRLKIDLTELEWAFENASGETTYLLDRETGATVMITEDLRIEMNRIEELMYGEEEELRMSFEDALEQASPADWMVDELIAAHQAEIDESGRYIQVPSADSSESYRDMEDFVETVRGARARDALWNALQGQSPFRRFRDALSLYPADRGRWFAFQAARVRQRVLEWLEEEGIEPTLE